LTKQTHSEAIDEALKQAVRLCDLETGLLMQRALKQRKTGAHAEADAAAQAVSEEKAA